MANLSASDKTPVNNFVDVEVEFDYVAELGDELTIQTGEIIKDVKRMSGGWWEGTLHGKRGLFPDNFVKVISKDVGKTKQLLVGASGAKEGVQLRASQKKQGTVAARKRCRVLYSYQPKHEDELELKVDDIVEFESEVEDGWWKGNLRGQCGVFPSNFVELLRTSVSQSSVTATDVANEETTTISVADKNKKNEKLKAEKSSSSSLVTARISSLIQDAESKTKKKSSENLNIIRRESPVGSETVETQKSKSEAGAPKLPPKPVKEQCIVLFPYNAVNDDELSLEEGQIVNVVTKEVEDKGWWKGELDGKVGVFPDNFVKLIVQSEGSTTEEAKPKKPTRPPATPVGKRDSTDDSLSSSKNSSREKLNGSHSGSLDRVGSFNKSPLVKNTSRKSSREDKSVKSSPPVAASASASAALNAGGSVSSPKKHSFGKSTPPPKPKPPAITSKAAVPKEDEKLKRGDTRASTKSNDIKKEPLENVEKVSTMEIEISPVKIVTDVSSDVEFDSIQRGVEKLNHPTADRVKAPKRRPPSSVFVKEAKLSADMFEPWADDLGDAAEQPDLLPGRTSSPPVRSNSQGSLSSLDDLNDKENQQRRDMNSVRHENKNRLSFKLVRQMKDALTGLTNGNIDSNKVSEAKDEKTKTKMPPPKPPLPTNLSNNEIIEPKKDEPEKKKPDWLEELSRKQAHRKSGLFSDAKVDSSSSSSTSTSTAAPQNGTQTKPTVVADKPHLPVKPSQIRDDVRKSIVFPKRDSSTEKELAPVAPTSNPSKQPPTSGFVRQPSKNDLKGPTPSDVIKSRLSLSPTNDNSPTAATATTFVTAEKPHPVPPPVEKSYLAATTEKSIAVPQSVEISPTLSNSISPIGVEKSEAAKNVSSVSSTHFVGGWKPPSPTKEGPHLLKGVIDDNDDLTLLDRIRRLEKTVEEIRTENSLRFESLQRQLDDERTARIRAETELEIIKRSSHR